MSLGSLGRLGIEIYADTAQFTGDLGKVERAAASMGASITGSLGGVLKGLGALGIGLAAVDFVSKTRDALDHADALGKMAQKTGLAVDETLQVTRSVGKQGWKSVHGFGYGWPHLAVLCVES